MSLVLLIRGTVRQPPVYCDVYKDTLSFPIPNGDLTMPGEIRNEKEEVTETVYIVIFENILYSWGGHTH